MPSLESQPRSIQSLYGSYKEGKLLVNRRYQRKLVWTLEEKQKLVESVINQYPVPAILIAENDDDSLEIIDGLQRLHALISFVENKFSTIEGKTFPLNEYPTALQRAQKGIISGANGEKISADEASNFLDYVLPVSIMKDASNEEIDDVFGRINTYGHQLSDQERRQAGVQDKFSDLVRNLASEIRGDTSKSLLPLDEMPSISIDLPKTDHGYEIKADQVFWVKQGILRSTDLRDSLDEQAIADILACIIGSDLIRREKQALDLIYEFGSQENSRISTALSVYGSDKVAEEIKYCISEIQKVAAVPPERTLKNIIFSTKNNNPFAALFTALIIAFHESFFKENKKINDYDGVRESLNNLSSRIDTGRGSTKIVDRRKNINTIKGLIGDYMVIGDPTDSFPSTTTVDIENIIRWAHTESARFELKQGILNLDSKRAINSSIFEKVNKTICAMANNAIESDSIIIIGVSDKLEHAKRIEKWDNIVSRDVGGRYVVGVDREFRSLGWTAEEYFGKWRDSVGNSPISSPLKESVLSNMEYHSFFGLGLVVITVPAQKQVSYYGDEIPYREGDQTVLARSPKVIAGIVSRFD